MKKLFVLFLLIFVSPVNAIPLGDGIGMCGAYKYDNIYASFTINSYNCAAGTYLPKQSTACVQCPVGFACDGGTYDFNETSDQGIVAKQYGCESGYFLPAASETCVACPSGGTCPGGVFLYNGTKYQGLKRSATYMNGNEAGVCAANYAHRIYAVFTQNDYVCKSGYFLPAASESCALCPAGFSCAGGTFHYDAKNSQGLTRVAEYYTVNEANACAANFPHTLNAVFTPNVITINWFGSDAADVVANNAGTFLFNGDIRTPRVAPPAVPGKTFVGWSFIPE